MSMDIDEQDGVPQLVEQPEWEAALADLRAQEKAAKRQVNAVAAARR